MKLVCVSHPCVAPPNQEFYARVERLTGWDLTIVLPESWTNELSRFHAERWPSYTGSLRPFRVLGGGSVPLHVYAARLGRVFRNEHPDAVYVHNEPYALATFQAMRAAPTGVPVGFYSAQNIAKARLWPLSAMEMHVFRRASFALPVSAAVFDVLRSKGYEGPAEVLPLVVDTAVRPPARDRTGDELTIGYVGRLVREKGVDLLLDALALLPEHVRAVVAGAGPEERSLRDRAATLGLGARVEWLGYVPHTEAQNIMAGFDLLIVPSRSIPGWQEQFGRVVVESLAVEVPVVTSDCGSLPQLVRETEGGWTFPEGDARSLAALVARLASDKPALESAGKRGRDAVAGRFGLDAIAGRFVEIVEAALRAAPRARV